jgi:hypothetical protein
MADLPATLFEQVYGRAATAADRERLVRVKAGLGLSAHDELWPVLMVLDYYSATTTAARADILKALATLPGTMDASMREMEKAAGRRAAAAVAQAVTAAVERLSRIVAERALKTAENISAREKITSGIVGALLALVFAVAGGAGTYLYIASAVGICDEPPGVAQDGRWVCYVADKYP